MKSIYHSKTKFWNMIGNMFIFLHVGFWCITLIISIVSHLWHYFLINPPLFKIFNIIFLLEKLKRSSNKLSSIWINLYFVAAYVYYQLASVSSIWIVNKFLYAYLCVIIIKQKIAMSECVISMYLTSQLIHWYKCN